MQFFDFLNLCFYCLGILFSLSLSLNTFFFPNLPRIKKWEIYNFFLPRPWKNPFARPQRRQCMTKTSNFPSYTLFLWMIFRRCLPNILFPVFMDASFFTAPHLHLPNLLIRACLHGVEGPQLGEVTPPRWGN